MNKKGFTFVELLAVIVILGLLSSLAIIGTRKYLERAKNQAYKELDSTIYQASQSYILEKGISLDPGSSIVISYNDLVSNKNLDSFTDPDNKNSNCNGSVTVTGNNTSSGKLTTYKYVLNIVCSKYRATNKEYSE